VSTPFSTSDVPVVETDQPTAPAPAGTRLPYSFARRQRIAVSNADAGCVVYHTDTTKRDAFLEVQRVNRCAYELREVDDTVFERVLTEIYGSDIAGASQLSEDLHEELGLADAAAQIPTDDLLDKADEAPIIRFINALLSEAIRDGASDVHIEPFENHLLVRFRVDGQLAEKLRTNRSLAPQIASRIKVMARLDIAEKRLPQDGRMSLRIAGRPVDVRLSTLPSNHGERLVLRLLDKQAGRLDLNQLGMPAPALQTLRDLVTQPHGIVLVTGPTGSGKTTTLYAALSEINDGQRNIMTVEDPIEYDIAGIGQTQVNSKIGMTFAGGLRAILRQDPDVVMVGEIRDVETAEIAVQASLTGHLVLSTLHTNTAVGAITRLRDMGVEPFLIGSSLTGVIAQRLVRRLCPDCRTARPADDVEAGMLGIAPGEQLVWHPVGCDACNQLGYRGRFGLYDILVVDDAMRHAISRGDGETELLATQPAGRRSLRHKATDAVLAGETSPEEALRILRGTG
jgi:general secretion pathway protein E